MRQLRLLPTRLDDNLRCSIDSLAQWKEQTEKTKKMEEKMERPSPDLVCSRRFHGTPEMLQPPEKEKGKGAGNGVSFRKYVGA